MSFTIPLPPREQLFNRIGGRQRATIEAVAYFIISTRPPTGAQEGTPKRHHRGGGEKTIIFCKKSSFIISVGVSIEKDLFVQSRDITWVDLECSQKKSESFSQPDIELNKTWVCWYVYLLPLFL
jgi:hypothetical protein